MFGLKVCVSAMVEKLVGISQLKLSSIHSGWWCFHATIPTNEHDKVYIAPLVSAGRSLVFEAPGPFLVHTFSGHLISHLQSSQIFT